MKRIYVLCRNGIPWRCYDDLDLANSEVVRLNNRHPLADWQMFITTLYQQDIEKLGA